ncbi:MafI family immunity protein [Janthinobacterium sp. hw3]|uniref:MafI family immunity protein n=2 Tax=Janthinobacterium fluminis TaxID=2987524 RepID=A0ABT5JYJ6_9BURK|nr:MafI family immunity protein [Janthinobacterium fluminis]
MFTALLRMLEEIFSAAEIAEVREFLDAGEYGLALDTLVDIVVEEGKRVDDDVALRVRMLATAMRLEPEAYVSRLAVQREDVKVLTPRMF